MNLRTVVTIAAVVAILFGLALVLMTPFMATTYGLGTSASELLLARFFGAELLVVGLINWLAKDFTGAYARPIILGNMLGDLVGAIVALMGQLGGAMNSMGWSAFAIYLLIGLAFAYFQFMAQPTGLKSRHQT